MSELLKLIIVDDETLPRKRIKSFQLSKHGYEIVGEAENGSEALELVDSLRPDIVVTDIVMPVMDGLDLLKSIKKMHFAPKVVLLTCYDDFEKVQKAVKLGASDYIIKLMLQEEDFINALNKIAIEINKEKQTYRRTVRKMLSNFILEKSGHNLSEAIDAMKESGFNPMQFRFASFEALPEAVSSADASKLCNERWDGDFCHFPVLLLPERIVFFTFSMKPSSKSIFDEKSNIFFSAMFDSIKSEVSKNQYFCRILKGSIYYSLDRLGDAKEELLNLFDLGFYSENMSIVTFEGIKRKICSMPSEKFQKIINSLRKALDEGNGVSASQILLEWKDCIDTEFLIYPSDVKLMLAMLASCIPSSITITQDSNLVKPLNSWLKEKAESAFHISEIKSAAISAALRLSFGLQHERASMRSEIKQAIEYVNSNFSDEISLADAARHVNLSQSWFAYLFKAELGMSFWDYLTSYRIRMAKHFLTATDLHITEIADKVGIHDCHYFSRLFSKNTGFSPSEYRKKHRI
ncbi:MAG: response regulator [Clostridia bacterium]|nr:response regulator [Clostridia bacterium]